MLDEKEKTLNTTVPPPEALRAKMRVLAAQLAGKDTYSVGTGAQ
jgi:hypothetical protein